MIIPATHARRFAIQHQLLDGPSKIKGRKKEVLEVIRHLGYVQIDTINVVKRAHHHTLWTRVPGYSPKMLEELQAEDRMVFEYWGHAASYLPMDDYRFYIPLMRSFPWNEWTKRIYLKHKDLLPKVLERIKREGPLGSADFKAPQKKRGTWWDWKPAKTALELLMWRGDLMVTGRKKFQRTYDLTENVLPTYVDTTIPGEDEVARFQIKRALSAHGVASQQEIRDYLHIGASRIIPEVLIDMVDSKEITKVQIEGLDDIDYYVLTRNLDNRYKLARRKSKIHLLSPFDNCTINRRRLERLFEFSYSLECYLPVVKRKYGYFSLPLLWGEDFVGRLDPKADRKKKELIVRSLTLEPGIKIEDGIMQAMAQKLSAYARFNSCQKVTIEKTEPKKVKNALSRIILTKVA